MKRFLALTTVLVATFPSVVISGHVGPPDIVFYQGRLTNNLGNPVSDGDYNMIFRIYDAPAGGNLKWAETTSVAVSGGLLSVQLGSKHSLSADIFQGVIPDFLEISVNGETFPTRTQLVSSPYSLNTSRVTGDIQTSPGEILFQGLTDPTSMPGIVFQDTTAGDTVTRYGPGGIVWVQPQPDPPGPSVAKLGPAGLVFSDVGPNHIRYGPSGMAMLDAVGDTTMKITPEGQLTLGKTLTAAGKLTIAGELKVETGTLTVAGGDLELTTGDLSVGGNASMVRGTLAGESSDLPTLTVRQSSATATTADVFRVQNNSGSANLLRVAGDGELHVTGQVSVESGLTVGGTVELDLDAGPSTTIAVGQRYRDNSIVAWGRVSSTGTLTNDFGVASVSHTTGIYTITLDASASLPGNLITVASLEMDAVPTTAASARMIYVDQAPSSSVNSFRILITNGSFAATDNDFMFMVTAR